MAIVTRYYTACPVCYGTGHKEDVKGEPLKGMKTCPDCEGSIVKSHVEVCPECKGTGKMLAGAHPADVMWVTCGCNFSKPLADYWPMDLDMIEVRYEQGHEPRIEMK